MLYIPLVCMTIGKLSLTKLLCFVRLANGTTHTNKIYLGRLNRIFVKTTKATGRAMLHGMNPSVWYSRIYSSDIYVVA